MIVGDAARIQHLLRRTAFGYRASDWAHWSSLTHDQAVKELLDYDSVKDTVPFLATDSYGALVAPNDTDSLKRYWLFRFTEGSRPLEETMTLFWHGHFATSDFKVQNPSTEWRQNQMFRKHALGNFRELIGDVALDPAMLVWLDGNNSRKAAPNENFSRELLELFSMGVNGGYTETDVKQGAKAFTGWSWDDDRNNLRFTDKDHDTQSKQYLGHTGDFGMDDALNIVARHPSTGRFISKKLFEFFIHDNPPPQEIDRLSKIYLDSAYSIREVVSGVLNSPHFYSDEALYAIVKSPTQYSVMIAKTLDIPYRWVNDMQSYTDTMGQQLFNPPNVKGWKTGQNWINTNTMTARLNFAGHAVDAIRYRGLMKDRLTTAFKAQGRDADQVFSSAEGAVLGVWGWLLPSAKLPDATYTQLVAYMKAGSGKTPNKDYWGRAHGLVELVITSPEYQLA
jgi:uncharacterized protein (DUF1800 family)